MYRLFVSALLSTIMLLPMRAPCAPRAVSPRSSSPATLCNVCIQADMTFLASDEMHGRGSATRDEHLAALYAAAQFESMGLDPGGDQGSFLQKVRLPSYLPQAALNSLRGFEKTSRLVTWNVVALLPGTNLKTDGQAILLTAHLDHLGLGPMVNGDGIYNGADDDASGTTAVLEIARALALQPRSRRTILFVLFGSEELGGLGSRYFLDHPPIALNHIVANLEFEMIGRSDPAVPLDHLWMSGYDRSTLGTALARHGAPIVRDPRPGEKFFQRSDNYALAQSGVVAHTLSSFGLHADYHQPSDDLSHIDFKHMGVVISAMLKPVQWLANTDWRPVWNAGGRP